MARDALANKVHTAGISTYKRSEKQAPIKTTKIKCKGCEKDIDNMIWSRRKNKLIDCTLCSACWRQSNHRQRRNKNNSLEVETGGVIIGAAEAGEIATNVQMSNKHVAEHKHVLLDHYIFN